MKRRSIFKSIAAVVVCNVLLNLQAREVVEVVEKVADLPSYVINPEWVNAKYEILIVPHSNYELKNNPPQRYYILGPNGPEKIEVPGSIQKVNGSGPPMAIAVDRETQDEVGTHVLHGVSDELVNLSSCMLPIRVDSLEDFKNKKVIHPFISTGTPLPALIPPMFKHNDTKCDFKI